MNWGLPLLFNNSETDIVDRAMRMNPVYTGHNDLNPHFFDYPTLYIYLVNFQQRAYYSLGHNLGWWATYNDFLGHYYQSKGNFYLMGRGLTVLFAVLTIFFVYYLGKEHFRTETGIWAALFLALSPLSVYDSHLVTADVPVVLFVVLTTFFSLNYYQNRRLTSALAAGCCLGLGIATKYLPGLMLGTLLLAHFLGSPKKTSTLFWGGAAVGLAFLAATPYALIDWPAFLAAFTKVSSIMQRGKEGLNYVVPNPAYYLYPLYITRMGFGLFLLALGGAFQLWKTDYRKTLILLFFPLVYLLLISSWGAKYPRYFLPIEPFLCLLAGYFVCFLRRRLAVPVWGFSVLLGLVVYVPLNNSRVVVTDFVRVDVRQRAKGWIEKNIPTQKVLIIEDHHTVPIVSVIDVAFELKKAQTMEAKAKILEYFVGQKVYPTNWLTWTERLYHLSLYPISDYIVVSSEYKELFGHDAVKYSAYLDFYRELEEYAHLEKVFAANANESGPTLYLYKIQKVPAAEGFSAAPINEFISTSAYNLANAFYRFKQKKAAEQWYLAALKIDPQQGAALANLGSLYFYNEQYEKSRQYIDQALKIDPQNPYALATRKKLQERKASPSD